MNREVPKWDNLSANLSSYLVAIANYSYSSQLSNTNFKIDNSWHGILWKRNKQVENMFSVLIVSLVVGVAALRSPLKPVTGLPVEKISVPVIERPQ